MSQPDPARDVTFRQQQVLAHLQGRVCTWDELSRLMKINDDGLGFAIGTLLDLRKIWTTQKDDVRVYGLERRVGLVPRSALSQWHSTDVETAIERRLV